MMHRLCRSVQRWTVNQGVVGISIWLELPAESAPGRPAGPRQMRLPCSYALRPDAALSPAAALWETLGYLGSAFKSPQSARARTTLRLDRHRLLPLTTLALIRNRKGTLNRSPFSAYCTQWKRMPAYHETHSFTVPCSLDAARNSAPRNEEPSRLG